MAEISGWVQPDRALRSAPGWCTVWTATPHTDLRARPAHPARRDRHDRPPIVGRPRADARPAGGRLPVSGLRPSASVDFNPDYTYAKQDLKRVGVMAASFIGALIVLYFVLPLFIK